MSEVSTAVSLLRAGGVIGLPTETVYGLAADGTQPDAVAKIFSIKGRPTGHPLILHLGAASWLPRYCSGPLEQAKTLADRFWPGPLTLVLPRNPETVPDAVTGGLSTVGVRMPNHPLALEVLLALDRPLAAPSANRFGGVSPTTRDHVLADLAENVGFVMEGGTCTVGIESTIVDLSRSEPYLLRPGAIGIEELGAVLGTEVRLDDGLGPAAPGTLESHYAPRAQVMLVDAGQLWETAQRFAQGHRVGVLALLGSEPPEGLDVAVFRVSGDLKRAAHDLYAGLRELDGAGCDLIISPLAELSGIGIAINDRLGRASAPRPQNFA